MRRQTGFTLVEQLTVLTVLSVLLAVSAPQLGPQLERQRLRAASSELLHALRFARANATLAGRPVVLCPSEDGESCTTRSDWSGGWIVYADGNRNQGFDAGEEMLLVHRLTGRGPSVRTSDGRRRIVYRDSGTSAPIEPAAIVRELSALPMVRLSVLNRRSARWSRWMVAA
jgi:type IV fimbrial biogenesis protein FimT